MTSPLTRTSGRLKLPLREVLHYDSAFGTTIFLYWREADPHWIDFEVFEAIGRAPSEASITAHPDDTRSLITTSPDSTGAPLYYATESRDLNDGVTFDLERAVWTACGFVKWDGCTQVYFPDEGPVHYDDPAGLRDLFGAICLAQKRCYAIMRYPEIIWPADYTARRDRETPDKGWLEVDVRLPAGDLKHLAFYDLERAKQALADATLAGKIAFGEPGLVLVHEVSMETVCRAVNELHAAGFFDRSV